MAGTRKTNIMGAAASTLTVGYVRNAVKKFYTLKTTQVQVHHHNEKMAPPSLYNLRVRQNMAAMKKTLTCTQEIDRAIDNLIKSGKFYSPGPGPRRESIPQGGMMGPGRQYMDHGMLIDQF